MDRLQYFLLLCCVWSVVSLVPLKICPCIFFSNVTVNGKPVKDKCSGGCNTLKTISNVSRTLVLLSCCYLILFYSSK